MSITPYSLFTAVLWSSAFILLLYFFSEKHPAAGPDRGDALVVSHSGDGAAVPVSH